MSAEKPEINYSTPGESIAEGEVPQHRFDLVIDGEKVGAAELDYFSRPLPLYQVTDLFVDFEHKGEGHASKILEQVEDFLKQKKKPGILVDAIMPGDKAEGMYARRGWVTVPDSHGLNVFNWPDDVPLSVLVGYESRYTDLLKRKGNS